MELDSLPICMARAGEVINNPVTGHIAFLAAGLLAGVAMAGPRRLLGSPWVWAGAAIALPVLPVARVEPVVGVNPDVGETIGWPELAATVAEVHRDLPTAERSVILTRNYGEAGAIDRNGPRLGLPPAYSGHNGYWEWGPPPDTRAPRSSSA